MACKIFMLAALAGLAHAGVVAPAAPVVAAKLVDSEYDPSPQYTYAYDVQDSLTGDSKNQFETRNGDVVQGRYSLIEADGTRRIVDYTADPVNGFNAVVQREPAVVKAAVVAPPAPVLTKISAPVVAPAPIAAPVARYIAAPVAPVARFVAAPAPVSKFVAAPAPILSPYAKFVAPAPLTSPYARFVAAPAPFVAPVAKVAAPLVGPAPIARLAAPLSFPAHLAYSAPVAKFVSPLGYPAAYSTFG